MCLQKIARQEESIPDEEGPDYGWKVFIEVLMLNGKNVLQGPYYSHPTIEEARITTNEREGVMLRAKEAYYLAGFHIFQRYEDAVVFCLYVASTAGAADCIVVRRVSYWGAVVWGRGDHGSVVVAQNMLVHPQGRRFQSLQEGSQCDVSS